MDLRWAAFELALTWVLRSNREQGCGWFMRSESWHFARICDRSRLAAALLEGCGATELCLTGK